MTGMPYVGLLIAALTLALPAQAGETVLLDFTADWCGPCQSVRPLVEQLAAAGYPVRQMNVDRHRALAAQYRVTSIPCFVMLVNGIEVDREVGPASQERLVQMLARADQKHNPRGATSAAPRMLAQSPDTNLGGNSGHSTFAASGALPPAPSSVNPTATTSAAGTVDLVGLLTRASVRLRVDDKQGHSFGTGTIIDRRGDEALVLTCGHLFRDSDGKGPIWIEVLDGRGGESLAGQLISYDLNRDLGLVSFRPVREVAVARVAPVRHAISKGQPVINVGCNNGQAPTVIRSQVTGIDKYLGPRNLEVAGMPIEGRSGGGLFDESGYLIGVCFAADPSDKEGVYAHLESIQTELQRLGLQDIVATGKPAASPAIAAPVQLAGGSEPPALPAKMPAHDFAAAQNTSTAQPVMLTEAAARQPAELAAQSAAAQSALQRLTDAERATLEELQSRLKDAEVICIVRPLANPQAKSEIIVLNQASPLFVEQLQRASQEQRPEQLTSHNVPVAALPAGAPQILGISRTGMRPTTSRRIVSAQEQRDALGWRAKR